MPKSPNDFVGVMNDVILMIEFSKFTLFNFNNDNNYINNNKSIKFYAFWRFTSFEPIGKRFIKIK